MKTKVPYNAGEVRHTGNKDYLIAGHIWWPVEQRNAYHCIPMVNGEPKGKPEYIWDHTDGKWPSKGMYPAEAASGAGGSV